MKNCKFFIKSYIFRILSKIRHFGQNGQIGQIFRFGAREIRAPGTPQDPGDPKCAKTRKFGVS